MPLQSIIVNLTGAEEAVIRKVAQKQIESFLRVALNADEHATDMLLSGTLVTPQEFKDEISLQMEQFTKLLENPSQVFNLCYVDKDRILYILENFAGDFDSEAEERVWRKFACHEEFTQENQLYLQ